MKRTVIAEIERWNASGVLRKPLILMGARQVGKSWLMRTSLSERSIGEQTDDIPLYAVSTIAADYLS